MGLIFFFLLFVGARFFLFECFILGHVGPHSFLVRDLLYHSKQNAGDASYRPGRAIVMDDARHGCFGLRNALGRNELFFKWTGSVERIDRGIQTLILIFGTRRDVLPQKLHSVELEPVDFKLEKGFLRVWNRRLI